MVATGVVAGCGEPVQKRAGDSIAEVAAVVRIVHGRMQQDVSPHVLAVNDAVFWKEIVETKRESATAIEFLDGTLLTMGPEASVTLDEFVFGGGAGSDRMVLSVAKGMARFVTGTMDKAAYEFRTPDAIIGVRGTEFTLIVDPITETTTCIVHSGTVELSRADGLDEVTLEPGYRVQIKRDITSPILPPSPPSDDLIKKIESFQGAITEARNAAKPMREARAKARADEDRWAWTSHPVSIVKRLHGVVFGERVPGTELAHASHHTGRQAEGDGGIAAASAAAQASPAVAAPTPAPVAAAAPTAVPVPVPTAASAPVAAPVSPPAPSPVEAVVEAPPPAPVIMPSPVEVAVVEPPAPIVIVPPAPLDETPKVVAEMPAPAPQSDSPVVAASPPPAETVLSDTVTPAPVVPPAPLDQAPPETAAVALPTPTITPAVAQPAIETTERIETASVPLPIDSPPQPSTREAYSASAEAPVSSSSLETRGLEEQATPIAGTSAPVSMGACIASIGCFVEPPVKSVASPTAL
jgi:hypothetical protein